MIDPFQAPKVSIQKPFFLKWLKWLIIICLIGLLLWWVDLYVNPLPNISSGPEVYVQAGKKCKVYYVPKDKLAPAFGKYFGLGEIQVRNDLPLRVIRFVRNHELYHCQDTTKLGGWMGREFRANIYPGIRDPIGLGMTAVLSLSPERLSFYNSRIQKGQ